LEEYNINQTTLKILGLYANDYRKSLHLRLIARGIKVDVKAVQIQLKRLENSNILSSEIRGRNKEYRPNLNNSLVRYYMVMAETFSTVTYIQKNFVLKKVADEAAGLGYGPLLVFGSFAKKTQGKESDIDLFAITDAKVDRKSFMDLGGRIDREINLESASRNQFVRGLQNKDPLISEVVADHILLRGADEFCDIMWWYHAGH
jgi:predicted nucleotidyltransferase